MFSFELFFLKSSLSRTERVIGEGSLSEFTAGVLGLGAFSDTEDRGVEVGCGEGSPSVQSDFSVLGVFEWGCGVVVPKRKEGHKRGVYDSVVRPCGRSRPGRNWSNRVPGTLLIPQWALLDGTWWGLVRGPQSVSVRTSQEYYGTLHPCIIVSVPLTQNPSAGSGLCRSDVLSVQRLRFRVRERDRIRLFVKDKSWSDDLSVHDGRSFVVLLA